MLQARDAYGWGCGMGSQWLWQSRDRRTNNPASSVLVIFNLYLLIPVSFVIRITLLLFRLLISIRGSNFKRCWRGLLVAVWGENIPSTRLDFSSGRKKAAAAAFSCNQFHWVLKLMALIHPQSHFCNYWFEVSGLSDKETEPYQSGKSQELGWLKLVLLEQFVSVTKGILLEGVGGYHFQLPILLPSAWCLA